MATNEARAHEALERWVIRLGTGILVALALGLMALGVMLYRFPEREPAPPLFQSQQLESAEASNP